MTARRVTPLKTDEKAREKKRDFSRAAVLAVGVHALLFAALFFAFQWKTSNEEVYAELWAETPTTGTAERGGPALEEPPAEKPAKEEPVPEEKPAPAPTPAPVKAEETPKAQKADIVAAQEKKKAEEEKKKAEAKKAEDERRQKAEAQKKADEAKWKAEDAKKKAAEDERRRAEAAREQAEKVKAQEAARLAMAKIRSQELARVAGGTPSKTSAGVPTGDRDARFQNLSGSARASFIARVTACIRPNIIFDVPAGVRRGQYQAAYRVRLLPTGDQVGSPQKTKASGLPGYDAAVERAIAKCPRFPSAPDGAMPSVVSLTFDPVDNR